ncbi:uncharacterized protein [Palaemon carinicauda]|uniref:uncharacterized protein n=1 Tax=Palaemon carinicauda TaxID=392227 RepID=UPI0035B5E48F
MIGEVSTCRGCSHHYFKAIAKFYGGFHGSVVNKFLKEHCVLPDTWKCPKCQSVLAYRKDKHIYYCNSSVKIPKSRKRRRCGYTVSEYKGTLLEGSHLEPWKLILFVSHWLSRRWSHDTVIEELKIATNTSVEKRNFCSEVAEYFCDNQEAIGGEAVVVEIDGFEFNAKYERGGPLSDIWVFGGIERVSKKYFMLPFVDRTTLDLDAYTLIPFIRHYVKAGSVIITDKSNTYISLPDLGYEHRTVDPSNPEIHIQNIKRLWSDFNEWVRRPGNRTCCFRQYFAKWFFLHYYPQDQLLHHFFLTASRRYQPQQSWEVAGDQYEPKYSMPQS